MKKYNILLVLLLISSPFFGQGIYNDGGKIVIGSGVTLNVSGSAGNYRNETNGSNGSLDLSGTLKLAGNLTNNATSSNFIGIAGANGAVVLNGSSLQTISGTSTSEMIFQNLEVNNTSGIAVAIDSRVNGSLTLTSGLADIGTHNLTLSPTTTVAGTPSATAMIVATNTGKLRKEMTAAGTFNFPVGDNTGTAEYSPVSLTLASGTFAAGAYVALNLKNAPFAGNSPLKRYWVVSQSGITSFVADATFNYVAADVTGTEASMYGARVLPIPVTLYGLVDSGLHKFSATGLSDFGTFTSSVSILLALQLKLFIEGYYDTGSDTMRPVKYNQDGNSPTTDVADITVELRNSNSPYALVDSTTAILKTNGDAACNFFTAPIGNYFIAVKGSNSIETWSEDPVNLSSTTSYDFTTSANKAFGNNMVHLNSIWAMYSGDINGDMNVDNADSILIKTNSNAFASGIYPTDLNGDGNVDNADAIICKSNSNNFIFVITP
jgi:hypothetical protein